MSGVLLVCGRTTLSSWKTKHESNYNNYYIQFLQNIRVHDYMTCTCTYNSQVIHVELHVDDKKLILIFDLQCF